MKWVRGRSLEFKLPTVVAHETALINGLCVHALCSCRQDREGGEEKEFEKYWY